MKMTSFKFKLAAKSFTVKCALTSSPFRFLAVKIMFCGSQEDAILEGLLKSNYALQEKSLKNGK